MDDLELPGKIFVPAAEIKVETSRSGGPGGQHVNKTESRVTLRWSIAESPSLPTPMRDRLLERLQSRLTKSGEILVSCESFRDQRRNQAEARRRLEALLRAALFRPKARRKTKPSRAAVERRLKSKQKQSQRKQWRRKPGAED